MTERTYHENALTDVEEPVPLMASMIEATERLIRANNASIEAKESSLQGRKNAIPLDLESFEWIAKTVSNLILAGEKVKDDKINTACVQLKQCFF